MKKKGKIVFLYILGVLLISGISIYMYMNRESYKQAIAGGVGYANISERCFYKSFGGQFTVRSLKVYENGSESGSACPTTRIVSGKKYDLSYKAVTVSKYGKSNKTVYGKYVYNSGGVKKTYSTKIGTAITINQPIASGSSYYEYK